MEDSKSVVKQYTIPRDNQGHYFDIHIHVPELRAENLSLQTWGSSHILACRLRQIALSQLSLPPEGIQVLELGAGTGLVGLSAAVVWGANVVLTDLAPIVPGLAKNIAANVEVLSSNGGSASCGTLDWERPSELELHDASRDGGVATLSKETDKASIIVAADTVYWEEHPRMLSKAIFAWLSPGEHSRVILTYPLRVAYLDAVRELWERLEDGGLEAIEEGKAETTDDWDDERSHEWSIWRWHQGNDQTSVSCQDL